MGLGSFMLRLREEWTERAGTIRSREGRRLRDEAVCRRGRESQSKPQEVEGAAGWVGWDGGSAPASIMVKMLRAVVTPWH